MIKVWVRGFNNIGHLCVIHFKFCAIYLYHRSLDVILIFTYFSLFYYGFECYHILCEYKWYNGIGNPLLSSQNTILMTFFLEKLDHFHLGSDLTCRSAFVVVYRQKLNSEARPRAGSRPALQHGNLFKTIGWDGASSRDVVAKKVRDTAFMRRLVTRHQLGLSVKANKLQKHYRPQVDF